MRRAGKNVADLRPEAVIAPAIGGVILSHWTADALDPSGGIPGLFAEKEGHQSLLHPTAKPVFRRGYDELLKGKKEVLVAVASRKDDETCANLVHAVHHCEPSVNTRFANIFPSNDERGRLALVYPNIVRSACVGLLERSESLRVDVVVSPSVGEVVIAQHFARRLSDVVSPATLAVYAENENDPTDVAFRIPEEFLPLIRGKRILVLEDVLTTGTSARAIVDLTRQAGGDIVGLGALCNRGGLTAERLDVPRFEALVTLQLEAFEESECPLCKKDIPVNTKVGKGREFLARKNARQKEHAS